MRAPGATASRVLFLSPDLSSFLSGRTIVVDRPDRTKFPYGTL